MSATVDLPVGPDQARASHRQSPLPARRTNGRAAPAAALSLLEEAFPALAAGGLGFIDVGSRGGFHQALQEIAPLLELVGFEPDGEECDRLNAQRSGIYRSVRHMPCGLGRSDGRGALHLCRVAGTSSLYRPHRSLLERFPDVSRFDVIGTHEVALKSLDSLASDPNAGLPRFIGFLKIDTQGAELDVLIGATRLLREQVIGLEVEVAFTRLYEGQPVFRDVDGLLSSLGFTLFKLRRYHWVRNTEGSSPLSNAGQLMFADALYFKDPLSDGEAQPVLTLPQQAEALVLLASLYDLHDFALELLAGDLGPLIKAPHDARRYVLARGRRVARQTLRRTAAGLWSGLSACVRERGDLKYLLPFLRRHHRSWARGDADFYTQL